MSNIIIGGLIIALLVGILLYMYFKDNGRDPKKGFLWGFTSVLMATAILFFIKNKKEE